MWIKIKDFIRPITNSSNDYDEKCIKVKFNPHDELPLNKTAEIPTITIVATAILLETNKYYPQMFLDKCLYKI